MAGGEYQKSGVDARLTERKVELRAVKREDLELFLQWRSESSGELRTGHRPLTSLNQEEFFKKLSFDNNMIVFTACVGGEPVGYVQLYPIDWRNRKAEVGVIMGRKRQGQGLGEEALRLIVDYGFKTLNLKRIYAEIYFYNKNSIKLFEKIGFKKEGVLRSTHYWDGCYHDSIVYSILQEECDDSSV